MNMDMALDLGRQTLLTAAAVCAPIIGFAVVVGLVVAVLQALTQVNEMALTFAPKLLALVLGLALLSGWMLQKLVFFTQMIINDLPRAAG
ncbi:MAG: flagellar type III secretion system protein FliQ [Deltaproteobacteria bacterium]|nr:flagellar type III secretion system protein FliQ [Deltaproteobacteria bacterium]